MGRFMICVTLLVMTGCTMEPKEIRAGIDDCEENGLRAVLVVDGFKGGVLSVVCRLQDPYAPD